MKINSVEQFTLRHGGRTYGQVDHHGQIMVGGRTTASQAHAVSQRWPAAQERPALSDGYPLCPKNGHRLGGLSTRNGLLRHDLVEPARRLAKGRRLEETPRGTAEQATPGRPTRLVSGNDRLGLRSRGARREKTGPSPVDRRKQGSKHHVLTDGRGTPLAASVTAANRNDVTELLPLVDAVPPVRGKAGRPRRRPKTLYADRAYDSESHRQALRRRGIRPHLARRRTEHGSGLGKVRYVAEQTQALLHQFKRLRTRYDRRDDIHESFLDLACSVICWRRLKKGFF